MTHQIIQFLVIFGKIQMLIRKVEGEIGLEGWTVYLDLNDNNILDDNDPNVVSDRW